MGTLSLSIQTMWNVCKGIVWYDAKKSLYRVLYVYRERVPELYDFGLKPCHSRYWGFAWLLTTEILICYTSKEMDIWFNILL